MKNNTKAIRLLIEELSTSDAEALHKWIGKRLPKKDEAETPALTDAELWWLAKLKSGNVLQGIGWPVSLLVDDLTLDYIAVIKNDFTKRGNSTAMGRFVTSVGAVQKKRPSRKVSAARKRRGRYYTLHGLDACRASFEAIYGKQDWVDSEESVDSVDDAQKGDSQYPDGE